jgi:hypothetical protein
LPGFVPFDRGDLSWDRRRFGDLTTEELVARMMVGRGRVPFVFVVARVGNKLRTAR